ncbi:MAG TPA: YcaO-like family protein [Gammaproteobacteria bacterium]|nr:YcaO-like family protein [Gammaproteobacteria bacterium]
MIDSNKTSFRVRDYAETLAILDHYRKSAGITRLADITHLDCTGLPVFTAIRPRAKSLSTSQGKGLCIEAAKCSALMEAIEVYFAENLSPEIMNQSLGELDKNKLPYLSPNDLNQGIIYTKDNEGRNWVSAHALFLKKKVWVPFAEFSLDSTLSEVLIYSPNTTGLAGGNTYQEALLHSVLELIEREAPRQVFEVAPMQHPLVQILNPFFDYKISYKKNSYDLPSFEVLIKSKNPFDNQILFKGNGCHLNKAIALNRAITEAIQSRVTIIAGSRDDILNSKYDIATVDWNKASEKADEWCNFADITDYAIDDIEQALQCLYQKIKQQDHDLLVFNYHDEDISVLKSKIISNGLIHHV